MTAPKLYKGQDMVVRGSLHWNYRVKKYPSNPCIMRRDGMALLEYIERLESLVKRVSQRPKILHENNLNTLIDESRELTNSLSEVLTSD